jgi:hypothetical protein
MRLLAVISGEYGRRHVDNIRSHAPAHWRLEVWQAPPVLPPTIDYPEEYVPDSLPQADVLLSFAEHSGAAQLLPELAKRAGARAVIAPVDREEWLPRGLARQLRGWLEQAGVACVTPKPLCSLTESEYLVGRRQRMQYRDPLIAEFAQRFGRPEIELVVEADGRAVASVNVKRDAVCGCTRFAAERLVGASIAEAAEKAGLLHHHYPCLASMGTDPDYGDTLMHISGNILKDQVAEQAKPYRDTAYIVPNERSEG